AELRAMLDRSIDGRIKLYVTAKALGLRKLAAEAFLEGDYLPLRASGDRAEHVVAFARRRQDRWVVTIVPRLVRALTSDDHPWPLGERSWSGTTLELPAELVGRELRDVLTGARHVVEPGAAGAALALASVFEAFPVAMLSALA